MKERNVPHATVLFCSFWILTVAIPFLSFRVNLHSAILNDYRCTIAGAVAATDPTAWRAQPKFESLAAGIDAGFAEHFHMRRIRHI